MTSDLLRGRQIRQRREKRACDRGGRDRSDAPISPGMPRVWERQGVDPKPSGGNVSCQHLDFGLWASRTVREQISIVFGDLL